MKKRKPVMSLTTMPMTKKQLTHLQKWLARNGILPDGNKEFALISQPVISRKIIDILLITPEAFNKVKKFFIKEGIVRA